MPATVREPRTATPSRAKTPRRRPSDARAALAFITPALLFVALWTYLPAALSFAASFFQIPLAGNTWTFAGLSNYASIVADGDVHHLRVRSAHHGHLLPSPYRS